MNHDPHDGRREQSHPDAVDDTGAARTDDDPSPRGGVPAEDGSEPADVTATMTDGADATSDDPDTAESELDLDALEQTLADVEAALDRLDAGTYWTDEVTGAAIPDARLAENPVTRRADGGPDGP